MEVVSILAGGHSARGYDVNRLPGRVIGVNDACWRARCDVGVTMDRLFLENRASQISGTIIEGPLTTLYARHAAYKNLVPVPEWITSFECDHTSTDMSPAPGTLNGTNSGMCALNLAYQMFPRTVILFGFDMCLAKDGAAYWYPPYPWAQAKKGGGKYVAWAKQFEHICDQFERAGVEVLNASPGSAIHCFHKIEPKSVLI